MATTFKERAAKLRASYRAIMIDLSIPTARLYEHELPQLQVSTLILIAEMLAMTTDARP